MIFERIGRFATSYRLPIIAVWIALAAIVTLTAPSIDDVASSDQADFLPEGAPFAHAEEVYREAFPNSFAPGNSVIVIDAREAADGVLNRDATDFADQVDTEVGRFITTLAGWLNQGVTLTNLRALELWLGATDDPRLETIPAWLETPEGEEVQGLSAWRDPGDLSMMAGVIRAWLAAEAPTGADALGAWATGDEPASDSAGLQAWLDSGTAPDTIAALVAWLQAQQAPDHVLHVTAPTLSRSAAPLMIAGDSAPDPAYINRMAIVRVDLATSNPEDETIATLSAIDEWLAANRPAGVMTYQTGAAPVVTNTTESITTSVDRTIWVTVALVIIMLLAVYRSPVSPFIPLVAVTIAYLITRGIVAFMGEHLITITSYANVMLVVVMYGAGTDYCLFLISRFREEMADHIGIDSATSHTVHRVGETITSSASTIFVGFMAMIFAEMGIFNTTGPALALGIVMSLAAGLTLVPALLATLGDRAFWPGTATHRSTGRWYEITSKQVSSYPLVTILVIVAIMLPLSIYALGQDVTYDLLADLPDDADSVVGYDIMAQSLGAGQVLPLTVVVTGRDPQAIAGEIVRLTNELAALDEIADVRGLNTPLGLESDQAAGMLRVEAQLGMVTGMFDPAAMTGVDPAAIGPILASLRAYVDALAAQFPALAEDDDLLLLQSALAEAETNPLVLLQQQAALQDALDNLLARFAAMDDAYMLPTAINNVLASLPASLIGSGGNIFAQLLPTYIGNEGTAFKLDVILAERGSSDAAMDTVHDVRALLKRYQGPGEAVVSGGTAITADIRDTMERDTLRAIGFVLLGIFIVLMLMLRSLVAPVYLIGTVLLSYTFTLGLTNLVFTRLWFDAEGLTWYVPFFIFVFLVALGIDYSIFLFGRIKEEVGNHGIREGVHVAVARTGAIITSAGMILSGTFAALLVGEIMGLLEVGFAVAVGVLIDTFVVRTILDPALAALFNKWTWWPGGVPRAAAPARDVAVEPGD